VGRIQKVLQNLLAERVTIRNLITILEALADNASVTKEVDALTEFARMALSQQITQNVTGPDGTLSVILLDPALEKEIQNAARQTAQGSYAALDQNLTRRIVDAVQKQADEAAALGVHPVILTNPQIRLIFSRLIRRHIPGITVLSYTEVTGETNLRSIGTASLAARTEQEAKT
jgi:flagellar biosynthesis protein FlhA